jgi:hypothetical protein
MKRYLVYLMVLVGVVSLLHSVAQAQRGSTRRRREIYDRTERDTVQVIDSDSDGVLDERDRCHSIIPGISGVDSTGCPTEIDPFADLEFDDKMHRAWYKRFWTGDCRDVKRAGFWEGLKCRGGERGSTDPRKQFWYDTVDQCVQKVATEDQGSLRLTLWELGRLVGHEWARDNDIRKIDSDDIKQWGETLLNAKGQDLHDVIEGINGEALAKLASD